MNPRSVLFAVILLSLNAIASGHAAEDWSLLVSGTWKGTYHYKENRNSVNFSLALQVGPQNTFTGTMFEPNTGFGPANEKEIQAAVKGRYDPRTRAVSFTKTYLFAGGHAVDYFGTLSADGTIIAGTWQVGTATGNFQVVKR